MLDRLQRSGGGYRDGVNARLSRHELSGVCDRLQRSGGGSRDGV